MTYTGYIPETLFGTTSNIGAGTLNATTTVSWHIVSNLDMAFMECYKQALELREELVNDLIRRGRDAQ